MKVDGHAQATLAAPPARCLEVLSARLDGGTDARYALSGEMDSGLPGFLERPFAAKARHVLIIAPMRALRRRVQSLAPRASRLADRGRGLRTNQPLCSCTAQLDEQGSGASRVALSGSSRVTTAWRAARIRSSL